LPCAAGVLRDHSCRPCFGMPGLPDQRSGCRHNLRIDRLRVQASWILPVASQNHWMRNGEVGQPTPRLPLVLAHRLTACSHATTVPSEIETPKGSRGISATVRVLER
jgi:hypothetical protein